MNLWNLKDWFLQLVLAQMAERVDDQELDSLSTIARELGIQVGSLINLTMKFPWLIRVRVYADNR